MPHLSEIQKKYKDKGVVVTGVNIWEDRAATDNSYFSKIEQYMAEMGDKMTYNVAADGYEGKIADAWMNGSMQGGIPSTFIVGKDGTVLWIGHPRNGLDEVLDKIVAGTYDVEPERKKNADQRARVKAQREVMAPINEALRAKDTAKALELIDKALVDKPELALNLGFTKYNVLLQTDEAKALAWAGELSRGAAKDNPDALNSLAWSMVDDKSRIKKPDYALAVEIAERGVALLKDKDPSAPYLLDTLAYALFKNGNLDRAIEVQSKALAAAEGFPDFDPDTMKEMRDRMDMFKKKKAGGG